MGAATVAQQNARTPMFALACPTLTPTHALCLLLSFPRSRPPQLSGSRSLSPTLALTHVLRPSLSVPCSHFPVLHPLSPSPQALGEAPGKWDVLDHLAVDTLKNKAPEAVAVVIVAIAVMWQQAL